MLRLSADLSRYTRNVRLHLECLEDRTVPDAGLPASLSLIQPRDNVPQNLYTQTEVMVQVANMNGLAALQQAMKPAGRNVAITSVQFDWNKSYQLFATAQGSSVLQIGLQPGTTPKAAVAYLSTLKGVEWAEPNYLYQGDPRDFLPNDPSYGNQYFHPLMQNNLAWDSTLGSASVRIAVLDDGVAINHPDLNANIWVNPGEIAGNNIDDDGNGYIDDINGWDTLSNDNNPNPTGSNSHGTHVAGIAAGRTNNAVGIAGVSGHSTLVPVRWYDGSSWPASVVAASYAYGVANNIKVFNASYNFDGWVGNNTVSAALDLAYNSGALLFNSAGNNGALNPPRQVFEQVILTASTTSTDTLSSFSNYGFGIDISAPGSNILSTVTSSGGTVFDYEFYDGTSMATPNAAGAAMLIWSHNPGWTRDQVIARMVGLADDISAQNPTIAQELGGGRVNTYKAMRSDLFDLPAPRMKRLIGLPNENASVNTPPTAFSLDVANVLDPATVSISQFELRGDGPDNTFGTGDDVLIPISLPAGFDYRIGTNRFNFTIDGNMLPDRYRFSALSGTNGLKDPFGQQLDGNGDGTAGDHYTRTFTINAPSLAGTVFHDLNGNGTADPGEPAVPGQQAYLDLNLNGQFDANAQTFSSGTLNLNIPDNNANWTSAPIVVSGLSGTVGDVNVLINLSQTYTGDMEFRLLGSDGTTTVNLITRRGGSGDNFINTVLDDQAAIPISSGIAPFTGSFRPEQPLSAMNGLNPNGTWTLQVRDMGGSDLAVLQNWSITIGSPEPTAAADVNGYFRFFGMAAGNYRIRTIVPAGFNQTSPASGYYDVTLPVDGFIGNLNFGQAQQNTIYGNVYDDLDGNGNQNGAETGLGSRTVYFDANNNNAYDAGIYTVNSGTLNINIPDNNSAWTSAPLVVSGISGTVSDVNVLINLSQTYTGDMEFRLLGPGGSPVVNLITRRGGSGDNFVNTILDDEAPIAISAGAAPFTGSYRPEQPLSAYDGLNPNGTWTLQVRDMAGGDLGVLQNWSLIITDSTAEKFSTTDAAGNYIMSGMQVGAYLLRSVPQVGWKPINPGYGQGIAGSMNAGESHFSRSFGLQQDIVAPSIQSVARAGSNPTNASSVVFTVVYSEEVTGVSASNFGIVTTGGISGAGITSVTGTGNTWTVTVNTGTGDGTIRLDHTSSVGITDYALNSLVSGSFTGEAYTIDKTAPVVQFYRVIFGNNQSYDLVSGTRFTLPWQISAIEVVFDGPVSGTNGSLIRTNGSLPVSSFTGAGTNTLRWTLQNLLMTDRVFSELAASGSNMIADEAGNALGNGTNYSRNFNVLWGDVNDDGVVSIADAQLVNILIRNSQYSIFADLNGDGVINAADTQLARQRVGSQLPT